MESFNETISTSNARLLDWAGRREGGSKPYSKQGSLPSFNYFAKKEVLDAGLYNMSQFLCSLSRMKIKSARQLRISISVLLFKS